MTSPTSAARARSLPIATTECRWFGPSPSTNVVANRACRASSTRASRGHCPDTNDEDRGDARDRGPRRCDSSGASQSMTISLAGIDISPALLALGAITGMTYGILAVGLILVYRANKVINFAHGEIGAFGAAVCGVLVVRSGLPFWVAFVAGVAT